MAWSSPHTYVVGENVTAATLNADIRDNHTFLHSPPSASAYNSANISIPNNIITALTFDSEYWDNATIHSTSTNTGRLTAPVDGVYLITLCVHFASGSGNRYIAINDGTDEFAIQEHKGLSSSELVLSVSCEAYLGAAQFAACEVYQNSGGNLNVLAVGNYSPVLSMTWIGEGT